MIAEPPRVHYAILPAIVIALAALTLLAVRGTRRERRGGLLGLAVGLGVLALAGVAALAGKDYVVERNLLPALVPLAVVVALGLALGARPLAGMLARGRPLRLLARLRRLRHPDAQPAAARLPRRRERRSARPRSRARSSAGGSPRDPLRWYLDDVRCAGSGARKKCGKSICSANGWSPSAPLPYLRCSTGGGRADGTPTIVRYVSPRPVMLPLHELSAEDRLCRQHVVLDGPPASRTTSARTRRRRRQLARARAVAG